MILQHKAIVTICDTVIHCVLCATSRRSAVLIKKKYIVAILSRYREVVEENSVYPYNYTNVISQHPACLVAGLSRLTGRPDGRLDTAGWPSVILFWFWLAMSTNDEEMFLTWMMNVLDASWMCPVRVAEVKVLRLVS
jgi:hypothetical protein